MPNSVARAVIHSHERPLWMTVKRDMKLVAPCPQAEAG